MLINIRKGAGIKHFNDSVSLIEYSNDIDDIYKNIEEYNPNQKWKILSVFNDLIADMLSNKKLNPIATEIFVRGRKINICHFLSNNLILLYEKTLEQTRDTTNSI